MQGQAGKGDNRSGRAFDRDARIFAEISVQLIAVVLPLMRVEAGLEIDIAGLNIDTAIVDRCVVQSDPDRQVRGVIEPDIGAVLVLRKTRTFRRRFHDKLLVEQHRVLDVAGLCDPADRPAGHEILKVRIIGMSMTKKAPFFAKADLVGVAAAILHRLVEQRVTDIAQYGQLIL